MVCFYGICYFHPLFCCTPGLFGIQIIPADEHQAIAFAFISLVGLVGYYYRHHDLDFGMDAVFLVYQTSAPYLYAPVALIYTGHQCSLQETKRTLHDDRQSRVFSAAVSHERCVLVVF